MNMQNENLIFENWTTALEASTDHGYENAKLGKLILDKTVDYRTKLEKPSVRLNNSEIQSLTAVGIVLSETSITDKVNVIDFGGACGAIIS